MFELNILLLKLKKTSSELYLLVGVAFYTKNFELIYFKKI